MPTTRGWLVAGLGGLTLAVGRIFGETAVQQLGIALLVLAFISTAVVLLGRHELAVVRRVAPRRARPGQPVTVTLDIVNEGRGSAPLVLLEDALPSGIAGSARFTLQGVEPGGTRGVSFVLRPSHRGRYEVGPLEMSFVDPFGLARARTRTVERTSFLVYPRVERLSLPRDVGNRHTIATSALRQPTVSQGEEFYTIREYIEGDDLRKIHWGSTAKRGRYMIRQEETPWQTRATIVLDDRDEVHGGAGRSGSFERAVEAAASVCDLYHRSGYSFRLTGAHDEGVPTGKGSDHLTRCLDLLATLTTTRSAGDDALLHRLVEFERSGQAEAALVLVTGTLTSETGVALAPLGRRFRQLTVVSFPAHRFSGVPTKTRWQGEGDTADAVRLLERSGIRTVVLGPDEPLAGAWSAGGHRKRGSTWDRKPELV